ncbi:MAG TPA: hypothetical protein VGL61_04945 [Kofleriaceae bacterium]
MLGPLPGKLARAASILDVDSALSDAEDAAAGRPLSVQIVGHGTSGQLLLGMTWMALDDARAYPFYVIDTNPVALGFFRNHRGKLADLTLVGCHVGSLGNPEIEDDAVNGRSLTFVLSELLECRVTAPTDYVATSDFKDGLYSISTKLTGWTWQAGKAPGWIEGDHAEETHKGAPTTLKIDHIARTSLAAKSSGPHVVKTPIAVDAIQIDKPALTFATPELDINLTAQGTARIVGNRRYVVTAKEQFAIKNRDVLTRDLRKSVWSS